jgi:spermidine/putrescine-binding protein
MTTGSATLAPYFAGDFITMYDSLPEDDKFLKFYYPEEGTNVFVDSMCILKSSKNVDAAKEYINFMLSRDAAVYNSIYIGYASPNTLVANTATGEYDEEYFDEMGEEAIEILYGSNPTEINKNYSHSPTYRMYVGDIEEHVYSLWESLKTENAIELWVHITSAVIIVSLLAVCISRIIIKKRRSLFYRIRDKKTN